MKVKEIIGRKFSAFEKDDYLTGVWFKSLEGFESQNNMSYNKIVIFKEVVYERYESPKTVYTLVVACDKYGETGGEFTLKGVKRNGRISSKSIEEEAKKVLIECFQDYDFFE